MKIRIGLCAGILLAAVLALSLAGSINEKDSIMRGISEGFELRGTYQTPEQDKTYLSLFEEQGNESALLWQSQDKHGTKMSGSVERTGDPNVYRLLGHDGVQTGWVHLAYSNPQAEGTLFVEFSGNDFLELNKASRVPSTFE